MVTRTTREIPISRGIKISDGVERSKDTIEPSDQALAGTVRVKDGL